MSRVVACLDENTIAAYFDAGLSNGETDRLLAHVDDCPTCAQLFFALGRLHSGMATDGAAPAPASARRASLLDSSDFDGYRIIRPIGVGAMGQVFLGHDTLLDRAVAIKLIASHAPDESTRERFRVEARAIARLQHPNVVGIYRVGETNGRPYLISEFVRGQNLAQLPLPLPSERVVAIGIGVARGLAAAHRRGVLHRDLKPANAILDEDDNVKLLDFGLAKIEPRTVGAADASSPPASSVPAATARCDDATDATLSLVPPASSASPQLTSPGALLGTPLYMAPEVWLGGQATTRSDIYSVGVMLFELASAQLPHRESDIAKLQRRVVTQDAPSLASLAPAVSRPLAAIVDRCLERDPEQRFASAEALREALEQLIDARVAAIPEGNPYRGLRAFEAEHRGLFFGRARAVRALVERLRSEPFVLVGGDSGVGKSSLCRAGVLPTIFEAGLGDERRWSSLMMTPGLRPLSALSSLLAKHLGDDDLARTDAREVARALRRKHRDEAGVVLFVDQLEELVTLSDAEEVGGFCNQLVSLLDAHASVRILATVRGDFLTRLGSLPELGPLVAPGLYLLPTLPPDGIRDAIVSPAQQKGVRFESEELVETLVSATAGAEGGLPLLQFALAELWDVRDAGSNVITAASLERLGGVAGALARHADWVMAALRPAQQRRAQRILSKLVTVEGTRAQRNDRDLPLDDADERAALEALVKGRLVVARESTDGSIFEIAHEALIKGWPALRAWLDGAAESRAVKQRLEAGVAEWRRLARREDALWSEAQLDELAIVDAAELNAAEQDFVARSRAAVRRRRLGRRALVAGFLLTVGLVYGGFRLHARQQLDAKVAAHVARADSNLAEARAGNQKVEAARARAFSAFDRGDAQAESLWDAAQAQALAVNEGYANAGEALEIALLLDTSRQDVKRRLSVALYERALLAERDHSERERDELLRRMRLNDFDGAMMARWNAAARLSITTGPPGAHVRIERYVSDERKRWVPTLVSDAATSPLHVMLPPGSYLLTFTLPSHAEVRYPLVLARAENFSTTIELPSSDRVPPGFVYIPAGRFLYGSAGDESLRRTFLSTAPLHEVSTGSFIIAKHETTFAEWIDFLEQLPAAQRARLAPRGGNGLDGTVSLNQAGGRWELAFTPTTHTYGAASGQLIEYQHRRQRARQDWRNFPVSGLSWDEVEEFDKWLDHTGRVVGARPCTDFEWERAARGADARNYPHGDILAPDDANFDETYGRDALAFGPDEVGSHPVSRSPFGLDDMAGNVWEFVRGSAGREHVLRGGGFYYNQITNAVPNREVVQNEIRSLNLGIRVCATR